MYYYAYAAFTNEDKNLKLLGDVKAAVNQSEITGVESTLSELRTMRDLVNDAKLQKATTFVVVGDDSTFHEALRILMENNGIPIGFIPFYPSIIADILGIPNDPVQAARILARRRTVRVPVGMANKRPFFSALSLKKPIPANIQEENKRRFSFRRKAEETLRDVSLRIEGSISLRANVHNLSIINLATPELIPPKLRDKNLPIGEKTFKVILEEPNAEQQYPASLLLGKKMRLQRLKEGSYFADGVEIGTGPFDVSFSRKSLKLIVGAARKF
ncbi:diacylglycerol/lipid kinase family protein [Patescibacteria group bacterium]